MQMISGVYISTREKAGKKKNGTFTIISDGRYITCKGATPLLRAGYPLSLTGEYEGSTFVVDSMGLNIAERETFIRYFSGRLFKGVGPKIAEMIYEYLRKRILNTLTNQELEGEIATYKIVTDAVRKLLVEEITGLYTRKRIEQELGKFGAGSQDIELLYQKYHDKAVDKIKNNPYAMTRYDVSFSLCDNVAFEEKYQEDDSQRIDAIFNELSKVIYSTGSSCMTVPDIVNVLHKIQHRSRFGILPDAYLVSEIMASDKFVIKRHENEIRVFTRRSMYIENHIAMEVGRLISSETYTGFKNDGNYEELDDDQRDALKHLTTSGIKIITGGPGAGKTTLIKKYIEEYRKLSPSNQFYLCAPTGRAAVRIQETSGYPAKTIHKLLGYQPYSSDGSDNATMYSKMNQFPVALFIVDEMSMVGEDLFLKFLEAVPNGSTVILSGDPNQLKSVDPGNVLIDMIESGTVPVCKLTHIHRQGAGSSIIKNYYRIKEKDKELEFDDYFQVMHANNEIQIMDAINSVRNVFENENDPYSFQIITFVKKGTFGKNTLNNIFAQQKMSKKGISDTTYQYSGFMAGDKIMMTSNNYQEGYWNGDVGIIKSISENGIIAEFYDGVRTIEQKSMQDVEHAWAATTHKSQGSEYDTVLIVIDDQYQNMLYNSLILTAATRAKERVYIISVNDALERSIENDEPAVRSTWLDVFLKEYAKTKITGLYGIEALAS